tara:strand:+ start:3379 stop:5016 length:1638 start_codon:yes stop_codon:yes gene_type:complete
MAFFTDRDVQISIQKETTFGTAATNAMEQVRHVEEGSELSMLTVASESIRGDRNIEDVFLTQKNSTFRFQKESELSYGVVRELIAAAINGTVTDVNTNDFYPENSGKPPFSHYGTLSFLTAMRFQGYSVATNHGATPPTPGHGLMQTSGGTGPLNSRNLARHGLWFYVFPYNASGVQQTSVGNGNLFRCFYAQPVSDQTKSGKFVELEGHAFPANLTLGSNDLVYFAPCSQFVSDGTTDSTFTIQKRFGTTGIAGSVETHTGCYVREWVIRADNQGRVTYDFDFIGKDTTYGSTSSNPTVAADHNRLTVHSTTDNVEVFATQKPTPEYDSSGISTDVLSTNDQASAGFRLNDLPGFLNMEVRFENAASTRRVLGDATPDSFLKTDLIATGSFTLYLTNTTMNIVDDIYDGFEDGRLAFEISNFDVAQTMTDEQGWTNDTRVASTFTTLLSGTNLPNTSFWPDEKSNTKHQMLRTMILDFPRVKFFPIRQNVQAVNEDRTVTIGFKAYENEKAFMDNDATDDTAYKAASTVIWFYDEKGRTNARAT